MTDLLNRLLRPMFTFFFKAIYPKLPKRREMLWFFTKAYFVNGTEELKRLIQLFSSNGYFLLVNYCNEDSETTEETRLNYNIYLQLLDTIAECGRKPYASLSLKMSQFGCFSKDEDTAFFGRLLLEELIDEARKLNINVTLDGERLEYAKKVMEFGSTMNQRYRNVRIRLQAYNPELTRALMEAVNTNQLIGNIMPFGFCKGAYHEPSALSAKETRNQLVAAAVYCARKYYPVSVDTNDETLISQIEDQLGPRKIFGAPRPSYGLLYNVRPWLARQLKDQNKLVYIYLPIIGNPEGGDDESGYHWEKFAIRRLIERPIYIFLPLKMWWEKIFRHKGY